MLNHRQLTMILVAGTFSATTSVAQAQSAQNQVQNSIRNVAGYLGQACDIARQVGSTSGTVGTIATNLGQSGIANVAGDIRGMASSLKFMCTLNEMTNYAATLADVDSWRDFGMETLNGWLQGGVSDAFGDTDATGLNAQVAALYSSLQNNVATFKANVRKIDQGYAVTKLIGDSTNSQDMLTTRMVLSNPTTAAVHIANVETAREALNNKLTNVALNKQSTDAQQTTEKQVEKVTETATDVIGNPVTSPGIADSLIAEARNAVSNRELQEINVRAMGELMKQGAVFSPAIVDSLSSLAKQQSITNYQLSAQADREYQKEIEEVEQFKEEVRSTLEDSRQETEATASSVTQAASAMKQTITTDQDALEELAQW